MSILINWKYVQKWPLSDINYSFFFHKFNNEWFTAKISSVFVKALSHWKFVLGLVETLHVPSSWTCMNDSQQKFPVCLWKHYHTGNLCWDWLKRYMCPHPEHANQHNLLSSYLKESTRTNHESNYCWHSLPCSTSGSKDP